MTQVARVVPQERLVHLRTLPIVGVLAGYTLKLLAVEIPREVLIEGVLHLPHGAPGLVVHPSVRIEDDVTIFQNVTIGRADNYLSPEATVPGGGIVLERGVMIGAGAAVLFKSGKVTVIGAQSVVGANAVVTHSIPPGEIWAGNPARKLRARP